MIDITKLATQLDDAAFNAKAIEQLSAKHAFDVQEAYLIQKESVARRLDRGEKLIGVKMGFTSRAKMLQMGVDDVIWGHLTDNMLEPDGGRLSFNEFVHPRVEPEIAFLLKKPLVGKVSMLHALDAVQAVAPALEIIDSRYQQFKFSLEDVIADNSSSSAFVIGPWNKVPEDISNLGMIMQKDGRVEEVGSTAAILGNPLRSLVEAARLMHENNMKLEAGWVVMAGAATVAIPFSKDSYVEAEIEHLGRVSATIS